MLPKFYFIFVIAESIGECFISRDVTLPELCGQPKTLECPLGLKNVQISD